MATHARTAGADDRARVLTTATLNAARILGLSQAQLARVLGISESTVSRMAAGRHLLKEGSSEWQLAALLVRLFRSLDALMAGD
ncbi:helix-turn-helix domain-containing protein, partial [Thiohalobacter sp.]|uniref:helix-turn-helix domain-containing protein n=1 Tax=Thiohalobacter sp. TaxID=2025948 RepID=UPI00261526D3